MLEHPADVRRLEGLVRYSRGVALSRLALVAGFVVLLALFTPGKLAVLGVLEFGLYLALFAVTEIASRSADPIRAHWRLRWQSDGLMFLLATNACWLAVEIRLYGKPTNQVEAALLAICVLLFVALRVHLTRASYFLGVIPPALTLIWIAVDWSAPFTRNHFAMAMLLFVAAVLTVTWRQQTTDRALTQALRDLGGKNVALTQAVAEAKAATRAKSDLLAIASHEIRTPLNAVLGFAQALRRQPLAPTQLDLIDGVLEGGDQLRRLLDSVLERAHADSQGAGLSVGPVDLRRMIHGVVRTWRGHAEALGADLVMDDADPSLPFLLTADEARLEQTIINLVANALGATPPQARIVVRLAGAPQGETVDVLVEVHDSGPDVTPEEANRLFETFDPIDQPHEQGSRGQGLGIAARNVALMGGKVGVAAPIEGPGAVFWFTFTAPRQAPSPVLKDPTQPLDGIRVLAAEDNAANRKVLEVLLSTAPVDLELVENGALALDAWRGRRFDLILMDANMPVLDGIGAVSEIRRLEPADHRTPIWMLTANVFQDDVDRYLAAGADGVIRKPIDIAALFSLLADVAEGRG